jgi:hypothetical protein
VRARYERRTERLASRKVFVSRVVASAFLGAGLMVFALAIGMLGYHELNRAEPPMTWLAAFHQAAMLLGGMGPVESLTGDGVVFFDGVYALFCGVILIAAIGVTFAPVVHRLLHRFHLADRDE